MSLKRPAMALEQPADQEALRGRRRRKRREETQESSHLTSPPLPNAGKKRIGEQAQADLPAPLTEWDRMQLCLSQMRDKNPLFHFDLICKIGEGTFSSVYKAVDMNYSYFDNEQWRNSTNTCAKYLRPVTDIQRQACIRPKLFACIEEATRAIGSSSSTSEHNAKSHPSGSEGTAMEWPAVTKVRYVALKKIYATSSPARIYNEIRMLEDLRGEHNVVPVITACRLGDQVVVVMPYFEHLDFRIIMHAMNLDDIRHYMYTLMDALAHTHNHGIIHRDVKPSNFLYDMKRRKGMLVDFGLAQRTNEFDQEVREYPIMGETLPPYTPFYQQQNQADGSENQPETNLDTRPDPQSEVGYYIKDTRPQWKAARAGTRGFRAPEVLFKVSRQTVQLDIWSAGVILLSLLCKLFPFFHATDDQDALVEIACILGNQEMERTAAFYGRRWRCTVPSVPNERIPWIRLVKHFNPLLCSSNLITKPNGKIESYQQNIPHELEDFLNLLLEPNHTDRITAQDALNHPFLRGCRG